MHKSSLGADRIMKIFSRDEENEDIACQWPRLILPKNKEKRVVEEKEAREKQTFLSKILQINRSSKRARRKQDLEIRKEVKEKPQRNKKKDEEKK